MTRFAYSILALCSAWVALIAYVLGVLRIGEWMWRNIHAAQESRWYGLQDIPVIHEVLAFIFLFVFVVVGIYFMLVLPLLLMGYVYDGLKRICATDGSSSNQLSDAHH